MLNQRIEPGLLRIFRYFTGLAMIYFALIVAYTALQTGQAVAPSQIQSYVNLGINLILIGYLNWSWLFRKLGRGYLPAALMIATVAPVLSNLVYFVEPAANVGEMITRSWLLLPILLVPLGLIAWQYRFRYVFAFIIFSTAVELSVLLPFVRPIDVHTLPILGVPVIRAFAFGTVGHIVSHLIDVQRGQRAALLHANLQLADHAHTLEKLATSRERNRLARELHDTLAHTLSGLIVNLEAIKIVLGYDLGEAQVMLNRALENTRNGLTETRRALKDLRSKQLEDLGLIIAIRNLVADIASRANIQISLKIDEEIADLPPLIEQTIYRITQEALENTLKHANARFVSITLATRENQLTLVIADDGAGFDPQAIDKEEELGLKGMFERATMVAGTIQVESQPGEGTAIHLTLEIPHDPSINL